MAEWCYTTRLQHKNNICSTYCMFRSIWLFGFGIYNRLHVCVTAIVLVYIMYVVCSFLVCMHFRHLQTQLVVWICFRFAHSPIDLLPVKNRPAFENRTWRLPHLWVLPSGLWRERREVDRRRGGGSSLKPFGGVSVHLFLEESGLGWGDVFFQDFCCGFFYPKAWRDFPIWLGFFWKWAQSKNSGEHSRCWIQIYCMFTPTWGNDPIWLFFNWVGSTSN